MMQRQCSDGMVSFCVMAALSLTRNEKKSMEVIKHSKLHNASHRLINLINYW